MEDSRRCWYIREELYRIVETAFYKPTAKKGKYLGSQSWKVREEIA